MRKITQQAVDAFKAGHAFKLSNTEVKIIAMENGIPCIVQMLLHGNIIATRHTNPRTNKLEISHCGWKTPTTKERLNGILGAFNLPRLFQKRGTWYIGPFDQNGLKIDEVFEGNKLFKF